MVWSLIKQFRRKTDVVGPQNLFTLLTDRLLLNASHLSLATYNVLYELLTEQLTTAVSYVKHPDPSDDTRFENSSTHRPLLSVELSLMNMSSCSSAQSDREFDQSKSTVRRTDGSEEVVPHRYDHPLSGQPRQSAVG